MAKKEKKQLVAIRKKRREERKAKKKQWRNVREGGRKLSLDLHLNNDLSLREIESYIEKVWPIAREILVFLKMLKITGANADKKLENLIIIGDKATKKGNFKKLISKLEEIWPQLSTGINFITTFTGPKLDKTLDQILHLGDSIIKLKESN